MHAKCYDELRTMDESIKIDRNKRNDDVNNSSMMTLLEEQKICCNNSLKEDKVHTEGAYWKLNEYGYHKGIGNYPQRSIVCLEPFLT